MVSGGQKVLWGAGEVMLVLAVLIPATFTWMSYLLWVEPSTLTVQGKLVLEGVAASLCVFGMVMVGQIAKDFLMRAVDKDTAGMSATEAVVFLVLVVGTAVGVTAFIRHLVMGWWNGQ
jgi:hypothetical protein